MSSSYAYMSREHPDHPLSCSRDPTTSPWLSLLYIASVNTDNNHETQEITIHVSEFPACREKRFEGTRAGNLTPENCTFSRKKNAIQPLISFFYFNLLLW